MIPRALKSLNYYYFDIFFFITFFVKKTKFIRPLNLMLKKKKKFDIKKNFNANKLVHWK